MNCNPLPPTASTVLDLDLVRTWLGYEPETGLFRWLKSPRYGITRGMLAGSINSRGYVHLSILGGKVTGHRLAWAMTHDEWPSHYVDHINGIKSDNRIANLRNVSQAINMQNQRRASRASSTGFLGVSPSKTRFLANITVNGKRIYLGSFGTPEEAFGVYLDAKREHHAGNVL